MCQPLSPNAIKKQKSCPFAEVLDARTAILLLEWSSPEAAEASAPSAETRPLSREYRRPHYVFRCFREIVSRCDNRVRPIDVDNRMDVWLLDREELVMVTTLCRAYDWLQLHVLWHLIHRRHLVHSAITSASPSTMASTLSMVHHHLHSPPSIYYM